MPRIARIAAFQVDLPLREGSYNWSGGKSVRVFDSTIVRVETDEGVVGHGEACPLGAIGRKQGPEHLAIDPDRVVESSIQSRR